MTLLPTEATCSSRHLTLTSVSLLLPGTGAPWGHLQVNHLYSNFASELASEGGRRVKGTARRGKSSPRYELCDLFNFSSSHWEIIIPIQVATPLVRVNDKIPVKTHWEP